MRTNINHTCCINTNTSINWEYTRLFSKIRGGFPFLKISICSCVTPLPPWHAVGWEPHLGSAVPEGILSQQPGALIWGHSEDHVLILISYSSVCGKYLLIGILSLITQRLYCQGQKCVLKAHTTFLLGEFTALGVCITSPLHMLVPLNPTGLSSLMVLQWKLDLETGSACVTQQRIKQDWGQDTKLIL